MATKVYTQKDITLQDDTEVTLKPLPIGRLRRFMEAWTKIGDVKDDDDGFDVFINCAGIAIEDSFANRFENTKPTAAQKAKGEFLSSEYRDYLLDVLDLDTIYEIIEVAGGIQLKDPKLLEALEEAATKAEQDGTS